MRKQALAKRANQAQQKATAVIPLLQASHLLHPNQKQNRDKEKETDVLGECADITHSAATHTHACMLRLLVWCCGKHWSNPCT